MEIPSRLVQAIEHYLSGTATEEEVRLVNEWYHSFSDENVEVITDIRDLQNQVELRLQNRMSEIIGTEGTTVHKKIYQLKYKISIAAACFILFLSAGLYLWNEKHTHPAVDVSEALAEQDIPPGGNNAVLKLADGSEIVLNDVKNGVLINQGNAVINKVKSGQLRYMPAAIQSASSITYNTIITPRGGQYEVILPDGSHVWLNAGSSLKFPTIFTGNERNVELTGEAYFEITKNKAMPFRVKTSLQTIEVLGTHFNVNAYRNENAITTTLLEGSVKVTRGTENIIIKPGQQAGSLFTGNKSIYIHENVSIEEVVAWKNGLFQFNNADLASIMRQLERWYDVEIDYKNMPVTHFSGSISRNVNLSKVLKMLEVTGNIHFLIESPVKNGAERRISVMR